MKHKKQNRKQLASLLSRLKGPGQVGFIVQQDCYEEKLSRCDEKKCGENCAGAKTCESLAGLFFNFKAMANSF